MEEFKDKFTAATQLLSKRKPITQPIASESGKLPPQAVDMEEAVLGAMMLEKNAINDAIDILQPESFYKEIHQKIYAAIQELFSDSQPIDILTVTARLRANGFLELIGGPAYIAGLTNRVASAANIEYHARIIQQKFIQRELIGIASTTIRDAYEDTADVFDLLDKTESGLYKITQGNIRKDYQKMHELIREAIEEIEKAKKNVDGVSGVPTGFNALDKVTSGWQKSDMIVIAARPGMGKCLGKGTKVVMFNGTLKNVEDIVAGDLLMGDDSTARTVLGTNTGQEMMYWVHQNHGISYRVNESHILSLKRSRNEGGHVNGTVLNIEIKDYLQKSEKFKSNYKGYKVAIEFDEVEVPIDAYYLGLWLGDGHSYSSRITNTDKEVIDFMNNYAEELELELVEYHQENRTNSYAITKGSQGKQKFYSLQAGLRSLDLLENKHIPHIYIANSSKNRLDLLAGLIDSDGHYNGEFNVYEITQKNEHLAKQIKYLCDTLGFKTSFVKKKAQIKSIGYECDVYRVRISGDIEKIPAKIERKKARERKSIIDWRSTGIKVEIDKIDDYYGFEIDGNHLFLLEDMTVTHNTAFVLSMARNASVDFNRPVAVFSLEMSAIQLVNRLIAGETELTSDKLRKGNLQPHEYEQLHTRIKKISEAPLFIDDTPALSIFELRAKCRRLKQQHGVELIIIDYLQLMTGGGEGKGNREQEISYISRSIKQIAKELETPIIALSQLSRSVETRGGDKRPMLSDLRESGAIEQDADIVGFIYRPEYYNITDIESVSTKNLATIIISKHRNGALADVDLKFVAEFSKFENFDASYAFKDDYSPMNPNHEFENNVNTVTVKSKMDDIKDEETGTDFNFSVESGDDTPF